MIAKDDRLRKVCRNYEQVENYEKAILDEERWELHHRREIDEMKSVQQLIDEGKYYDVDPSELIFLTKAEHNKVHNLHRREETIEKLDRSAKNKIGTHRSLETKSKISKGNKGKLVSEETRKKLSENHADISGENHPLFGKHHSEETKNKISKANKGKKRSSEIKHKMSILQIGNLWWNNGKICIRAKECPGTDFVRGRLKRG